MSDLGKFLPLSQRGYDDESQVSANWSKQLGGVLLQVAGALDELGTDRLAEPSMRPGLTIGDAVRELIDRLGTPRRERIRAAALASFYHRASRLGQPKPVLTDAELAPRVRELAVAAMTAGAHHRIGDLSIAVVTAFDISLATGTRVIIDPVASGAVSLARSLTAPLPIRAVVRGRTLVATDAGWRIGRGKDLPGTASAIVLFLFGRTGVPAS